MNNKIIVAIIHGTVQSWPLFDWCNNTLLFGVHSSRETCDCSLWRFFSTLTTRSSFSRQLTSAFKRENLFALQSGCKHDPILCQAFFAAHPVVSPFERRRWFDWRFISSCIGNSEAIQLSPYSRISRWAEQQHNYKAINLLWGPIWIQNHPFLIVKSPRCPLLPSPPPPCMEAGFDKITIKV